MVYFLIGVIIILLIAIGFGVWFIKNLTKQTEAAEDERDEAITGMGYYRDIIDVVREKMLLTQTKLTEVDLRGAFEADDEVGFVFKEIKSLTEELNQAVQKAYE